MKRTVKNKKVIQAITIGLAAMIAMTSVPTPVYADDEVITSNTENNENTNTQSEGDSISEVAGDCADIVSEDNNQIDNAVEAINDASDAVGDIITVATEQEVAIPAETLENIQSELQQSANEITQAGVDLGIAVQSFNNTLVADLNVESDVKIASDNITNMQNSVNDFDNANITTTQDANNTIAQATIANTSSSRDEAYAARDNAVKELSNTEKEYKVAEAAFNVAETAYNTADEKYQAALIEQQKVKDNLEQAKNKLKDANENATASNERLKAIQAQMNQLDKEVTDLAQSKDDLQALRDQYYRMMVHYYRDNNVKSAVYDDKGVLLVEESAKKAIENGKTYCPAVTENTLKVGRELMKDLIMYKLKANGAEDIEFAVKEKGLSRKESADGELVKDKKGLDKVKITDTQEQYWNYPSGDDGRHHRVKVVYTITLKDGTKQKITEYYNYIYKADKYNDNNDIVNGPIYLAQINPETGEVIRDTDKNNMDNFNNLEETLKKAIDATKLLNEYNEAKKAVDDAQDLVNKLNSTIKTLSEKDLKVNEKQVEDLKKQLDDAKKILDKATKDKDTLEQKVEEARRAVAAIDLSRFVDEDTDNEDETTSSSADITTPIVVVDPAVIPSIPTGIPVTITTTTSTTSSTGVVEGGDTEDSAGVAGAQVTPPSTNQEDPKSDNELVKIEDPDVPLAELPTLEDEHSILWWIFLGWLLLLLAYIIYKIRQKIKEKKEEKEKAKKEQ